MVTTLLEKDLMELSYEELRGILAPSWNDTTKEEPLFYCGKCGQYYSNKHTCYWLD